VIWTQRVGGFSLEAVEAWVEDVKANREQLRTLGDLTIISVPAI
jgi:hypothetical protein